MRIPILLLGSVLILFGCNRSASNTKTTAESTEKEASAKEDEKSGDKSKDAALIGLWKRTEILGSGEYSMTNETMLEFMDDGVCFVWPGRSIGPNYSKEEDKSKKSKGGWYTSGKELHFIDPATTQDVATYYTVNASGLLMSDGKSDKKLFVRVR